MNKSHSLSPETGHTRTLELAGRQRLEIEYHPEGHRLNILRPNGEVSLAIEITADGPVLHIGGGSLTVRTEGSLSIDADRISIHGREGMELSTGKDLAIKADGRIDTRGHTQSIAAGIGNVDISANDDVTLDGERIKMNC